MPSYFAPQRIYDLLESKTNSRIVVDVRGGGLMNIVANETSEKLVGAQLILRGAARALNCEGYSAASEITLASGRRADLIAIGPKGEILIVEIKSSISDFRTDAKWHEYQEYCDRLLFAVTIDFPTALLPIETGLIIADEYGGEVLRQGDFCPLAAARRKSIILRVARTVSSRLSRVYDPQIREII
jgi:hypothetical protein